MATLTIRCGSCDRIVAADIIGGSLANGAVAWLLCPHCADGSVKTRSGAVYPPAPAGGPVPNLPDDVAQAWREARTAHAVAAYTASEVMCRKILMHIAVDVAEAQPGRSFAQYIGDLSSAGYVTTGLRTTIDRVRARGNAANHELPASTERDSLTTLAITEHLLTSVYAFAASPDA
ncbi:MAG: uncharacterized protein JWM48_1437 [Mycobacterium sp.]|nr:uncharacterized protein [Mycobacterium sp.]